MAMNDFTIDGRIAHDSPLSASARIPGPTANGCTYSRKRSQGHPGARSGAETIVK
ncbi:hypothetical protein Uis1B_0436 [Bifidobacterium margollesii]|uniref:Uncharacterized protein n=2 Tax=Bifidobacterium margollesii TaxID=2020964 RepID=A0A2N5JC05_9BIFI|nr:hypothetical protein Uis1B_0436 [Bifidobacterium margollesii]